MVKKDNLELIERFKKHGQKTAASFYAEVIIGATPSKGCEERKYYYSTPSNQKRCNLTGECTPIV